MDFKGLRVIFANAARAGAPIKNSLCQFWRDLLPLWHYELLEQLSFESLFVLALSSDVCEPPEQCLTRGGHAGSITEWVHYREVDLALANSGECERYCEWHVLR